MPPAVLTLDKEERNGIHLIRMEGPLDSLTYDQFKDFLDPIAAELHARIVLDCRNLRYVNSRGITLPAHYQRTLSSSLAFFGIAALNARILKAIELLGVAKLVRLYSSVEEALAAAEVL